MKWEGRDPTVLILVLTYFGLKPQNAIDGVSILNIIAFPHPTFTEKPRSGASFFAVGKLMVRKVFQLSIFVYLESLLQHEC